jgi:hypothetical protein
MMERTTAVEGNAVTRAQKTEKQAAVAMPLSWEAQPLHLPGMSLDMGILFATVMADLATMTGPPNPCASTPTVNIKAASHVDMRRILANDMPDLIPAGRAAR